MKINNFTILWEYKYEKSWDDEIDSLKEYIIIQDWLIYLTDSNYLAYNEVWFTTLINLINHHWLDKENIKLNNNLKF